MTMIWLCVAAFAGQWTRMVETDPMTDEEKVTYVSTGSEIEFRNFPYAGKQTPLLMFQKHPKVTVMALRLEKGQILCPPYKPCDVSVRVDDQPMFTVKGQTGASGATNTVLSLEGAAIVKAIEGGKVLKISFPVYNEAKPIVEFDLTGFDAKALDK
jgi:hypothetical protein